MIKLSQDVERILITADTFSLRSGHKQLTAAVVLTFILEEYQGRFKNRVGGFFNVKHKVLVTALRQGDSDGTERYSDNLVMCLHKCKSDTIVDIDNFTEQLLSIFR